jgi:hypothetical protein
VIAEGASDCAALLDFKFMAIARPSCSGCTELVRNFISTCSYEELVIVADNDDVGVRGAVDLMAQLVRVCTSVRVIRPPAGIKDVREWKSRGAMRDDVLRAISNAIPQSLSGKDSSKEGGSDAG